MKVEHRILVATGPEVVFGIYQDVQRWPDWDPDTKSAFIEGPFQAGSRGRLTPTKGNTVPMQLTWVDPVLGFTVESKIPLFRMVFEHLLTPAPGGTEVVHRVTFSGALTFLLGRMLVRQLDTGLPVTLGRLKALAEQRATGARQH